MLRYSLAGYIATYLMTNFHRQITMKAIYRYEIESYYVQLWIIIYYQQAKSKIGNTKNSKLTGNGVG